MQTRGGCHWLVGTRGNNGHVMDLEGSRSTTLYKQSSFLTLEQYTQLNIISQPYY
jgi:hypothetical protein